MKKHRGQTVVVAAGFAALFLANSGSGIAADENVSAPDGVAIAAAHVSELVYALAGDDTYTIVNAPGSVEFVLDAPNGVRAALYLDDEGAYTLAFAGTNEGDATDRWVDAVVSYVPGILMAPAPILVASQVESALNFAESARIFVEQRGGSAENIVVTGHSLGGALAQIVGATVLSGSTVHTFAAPGAALLIGRLRRTEPDLAARLAFRGALNITNHVRFADVVTYAGGGHLGRVVTYPPDFPTRTNGEPLLAFLERAIGQNHSITRLAVFLATRGNTPVVSVEDSKPAPPPALAQPLQCRTVFQDPCHIVGFQLICDRPAMAQVCE